jgi:phage I-like protein
MSSAVNQLALDLGEASVHVPSSVGTKQKGHAMSTLKTKQRDKLADSKFADPANRKYPISDKAHADNAMARLEQQKSSMSPGKHKAIKARIRAAQRSFGEKNKTAAESDIVLAPKPSKKTGAFRLRLSRPDGGYTLVHHQMSALSNDYTAEYDEATKTLRTYLPLDKQQALSAGDSEGRVWVQCAKVGAWSGHPQGAFKITEQLLDQMVVNFRSEGTRRQYDFNHASAYPANSGNIPLTGTPAQGWYYDLRREGDKLFALTEWGQLAKQYIENDQYGGISPLINWAATDRVTNRPIGPLIKSIALTNDPFLLGMQRPTAASADGTPTNERGLMALREIAPATNQALEAYAYSPTSSMLSKLKAAFGLHELSTVEMCRNSLSNLASHLDAVDGDATASHEGVKLERYVSSLRDMVGGADDISSTELIQFIDKLLDEYMDENGIEDDDSDSGLCTATAASASEQSAAPVIASELPAATAASAEGTDMADPVIAPAATVAPVDPAAPAAVANPDPVPASVTAASATVDGALPSAEVARLALQNAALQAELKALKEANQALSASSAITAEQALSAEVDAAILTYKDTKGLAVELRPHLLSMLSSDPVAFRAMYPAVDFDKRHLLSNLTGGGASNPTAPGARVEADTAQALDISLPAADENKRMIALGLNGLASELVQKSGGKLSLMVAQLDADEMIRTARKSLPLPNKR